ncbi:unnamed protein product [Brachionus calyciflorus]|uniref:Uncharacterized protein n=1 Tax=Brachionus calyciflorus TaxID=104777 RepID=A0A814FI19_9BILA|nr:unnamed protein product [Brachionus calyciflorus]
MEIGEQFLSSCDNIDVLMNEPFMGEESTNDAIVTTANKSFTRNLIKLLPKENNSSGNNKENKILNEILLLSKSDNTTSDQNLENALKNSKQQKENKIPRKTIAQICAKTLVPQSNNTKTRTQTCNEVPKIIVVKNNEKSNENRMRTRSLVSKSVGNLIQGENKNNDKIAENKGTPKLISSQMKKANGDSSKGKDRVKRIYRKKPLEIKPNDSTSNTKNSTPVSSSVSLSFISNNNNNNNNQMEIEPANSTLKIASTSTSSITIEPIPNRAVPTEIGNSTPGLESNSSISLIFPPATPLQTQSTSESLNTSEKSIKEEKFEIEKTEHFTNEIDLTLIKLVYFNTAGLVNDIAFDSILKTLNFTNRQSKLENNANMKSIINKKIVDYIDTNIAKRATESPLYSIIIETDDKFSAFYAYIKFLDHSGTSLEKNLLVKIFDIKPVQELFKTKNSDNNKNNGYSEFKLSKYLFEQIRVGIIQQYKLNPRNFISVLIDINILIRLCHSSLKTYLKDLLNKDILILPRYNLLKLVNTTFNKVNLNEKLCDYFATYQKILNLIENCKIQGLNNFHKINFSDEFEFNLDDLSKYTKVVESIYSNYSILKTSLSENKFDSKELSNAKCEINEKLNSVDYFYMTCLLVDLFKFLVDYKLNAKKFSSKEIFHLPWNLNGSYLKNLYDQQLTDEINRKASNDSKNLNQTIELENESLNFLDDLKKFVEDLVQDLFDICSENSKIKKKFFNLINSADESEVFSDLSGQDSPFKIYSYLNELFDVSFKFIHIKESDILIEMCLNDDKIQFIIDYYYTELRDTITVQIFKDLYSTFFDKFFKSLNEDIKNEFKADLMESEMIQGANFSDNLIKYSKSLLEPNSLIKEKFINFSFHNKKESSLLIISSLSLIFLSIPSLVDLERKFESDKNFLTNQELIDLERRLKFSGSFQAPNDKSLINFEQIKL